MSFFGKFFGARKEGPASADSVWFSESARRQGLRNDVDILVEDENSVVVVAWSMASTDTLAGTLAEFNPVRCLSGADAASLHSQLAKPGAVTIALPGALETAPTSPSPVPLEVLVYGRNERRSADAAIEKAAAAHASSVHTTFHLSLDDPLFGAHAANLKPMLEKLGMNPGEAIEHPLIQRAIRNAQQD